MGKNSVVGYSTEDINSEHTVAIIESDTLLWAWGTDLTQTLKLVKGKDTTIELRPKWRRTLLLTIFQEIHCIDGDLPIQKLTFDTLTCA